MHDVEDRLRAEGRVAASGHLSIDRARAREQLRKFRLADPHLWVLQLVRAASIVGATEVSFTIDADEVECVFDRAMPDDVVADLWNRGYGPEPTATDRAAYQLALGLSAASAMKPSRIVVETSGGSGARMTMVNDIEEVEVDIESGVEGTRVYLRERFRFGHLIEYFDAREGVLAEILALRRYCAFSSMKVRVNGRLTTLRMTGRWVLEVDDASRKGRMLLERDGLSVPDPLSDNARRLRVALLRNDVLAEVHVCPPHEYPAMGCIDSERVLLDLSNTRRIRRRDDDAREAFVVFGPYHALLAERVVSDPVRLADADGVRRLLGTYVTWRQRLEHRDVPLAPGSERLFEHLMTVPYWPAANGPDPVPVQSAIRGEGETRVLLFAEESFEEADPKDGAILRIHGAEDRRTLRALSGLLRLDLEDRTAAIRRAREQAAIVSGWTQQRSYREPLFAYRREVIRDGSRGWVFVPTEEVFTPGLDALRSTRIYVDGTMAEFVAGAGAPFGAMFDGSFDVRDGRVERDDAFEVIATDLALQAERLVEDLTERHTYAEYGTEVHDTLFWWLRHSLSGDRDVRLLEHFGLEPDRARRLADELDTALSPGAVSEVRLFRRWPTGLLSLQALERDGQAYWISPETASDIRRERSLAETAIADDDVLILDRVEREFLGQRVRLKSARDTLIDSTMRASYLARPPFCDSLSEERVITRRTDETDERRIEVTLVDATWPGCEVFLVYEDRLLGVREFRPEFGRFRVTVDSERLSPDTTWSDAAPTAALEHLLTEVRGLTGATLDGWWDAIRQAGDVPEDPFGQMLYLGVAIKRLVERGLDTDVPALPVVVPGERGTERRLASWDELATAAAEHGFLPFVRGRLPDRRLLADIGIPALLVGHGVDDELLGHLFPAIRLRDVTRTVEVGSLDPRRAFEEQLQYPRSLLGALVDVPVSADGMEGRVGYYGAERDPAIEVAVLHHGRLLTTVSVAVPFGTFRAVVDGESLVPNDRFDGLAEGMTLLQQTMREAAAECLRLMLGSFDEGDEVALSAMRDDALRLIGWVRSGATAPPFDLQEEVAKVRFFRTTAGRRLSLGELAEVGTDGVMPVTSGASEQEAIFVPREQRALLDDALVEWTLRPVHENPGESSPAEREPSSGARPDWLLQETVEALGASRGEMSGRASARLDVQVEWATRSLDGIPCTVRGRRALIDPDHPMVDQLQTAGPSGAAYLASVIATEVNRRRGRLTDRHELDFQRGLLQREATR